MLIVLGAIVLLAVAGLALRGIYGNFAGAGRLDPSADAGPDSGEAAADGEFFGLTRMHRFEVALSAEEWDVLQTSTGRGPRNAIPEDDFEDETGRLIHRGGGFGGTFPWVRADIAGPTTALRGVGLRYKGNASFIGSQGMLRRNLKVKTDVYGDGSQLEGMKTLNFNSGALDPSRIRESLSYAVFRAAGVPAPRTAFAEVAFRVPGRLGTQLAGVYTVVEQVNKPFLKRVLPPGDGLLFKPERLSGGITYYGENWRQYEATYRPDREPAPGEARRLIDFARLVAESPPDEFARGIESFLDVDNFLRYVAVNALLANMDSYLNGRHNFYLYLDPRTDRFFFIPWDQDLSMAAMGRGNSLPRVLDLSLEHPYAGENPLIARVLAQPAYLERYRAILRELAAGAFSSRALRHRIALIEDTTEAALARERAAMNARAEMRKPGRGPSIPSFLAARLKSIDRQLNGTSDGSIAPAGRGGP